jgi:hypothetical protein
VTARFDLGALVATPGALETLGEAGVSPLSLLQRHVSGDWGELDGHDRRENERSLKNGWRLLSSYGVGDRQKVWIITEADRSSTCILRPEEY